MSSDDCITTLGTMLNIHLATHYRWVKTISKINQPNRRKVSSLLIALTVSRSEVIETANATPRLRYYVIFSKFSGIITRQLQIDRSDVFRFPISQAKPAISAIVPNEIHSRGCARSLTPRLTTLRLNML